MMQSMAFTDDDQLNELNMQVCERPCGRNALHMRPPVARRGLRPCDCSLLTVALACACVLQLEVSVRDNEQLMCENELFAAYLSRHASVRCPAHLSRAACAPRQHSGTSQACVCTVSWLVRVAWAWYGVVPGLT